LIGLQAGGVNVGIKNDRYQKRKIEAKVRTSHKSDSTRDFHTINEIIAHMSVCSSNSIGGDFDEHLLAVGLNIVGMVPHWRVNEVLASTVRNISAKRPLVSRSVYGKARETDEGTVWGCRVGLSTELIIRNSVLGPRKVIGLS
jgi:hypothetical protein